MSIQRNVPLKQLSKRLIDLLFLLSFFLICSCQFKEDDIVPATYPEMESVSVETFPFDCCEIDNCDKLFVLNNKLVSVNSFSQDGVMQLWDIDYHSYLGKAGYVGRGKDDISFMNVLCCNSFHDKIYIHEQYKYSIFECEFGNEKPLLKKRQSYYTEEVSIANSFILFDDFAVLSSDNSDNVEFYKFNNNTKEQKPLFSFYNFKKNRGIMPQMMRMVFQGHAVKGPNSKYAVLYSNYPIISINDVNKKTRTAYSWAYSKDTCYVDFKEGKLLLNKICYHDACSNEHYICGLYYGIDSNDAEKTDPQTYKPEIHIWDWNGNFLRFLKINVFANHVAIDKNNILYMTSPFYGDRIFYLQI